MTGKSAVANEQQALIIKKNVTWILVLFGSSVGDFLYFSLTIFPLMQWFAFCQGV